MRYQLEVENIKCGGCAASIKKGLLLNKKVSQVTIDVEKGLIDITGAKDLDMEQIKTDLLKLGYPEKNTENKFLTKAKSYISCAIGKIGK